MNADFQATTCGATCACNTASGTPLNALETGIFSHLFSFVQVVNDQISLVYTKGSIRP